MVADIALIDEVPVGNALGEGVVWNDRTQTVWWTDIEGARLFEFDPVSKRLNAWQTPHRLACFGFVENDDSLVAAFDRGIARFNVATGEVDWLVAPGFLPDGVRFNDGKIDPLGRFWIGTMVEKSGKASRLGALYQLDPHAGLIERVAGVSISNGLCWSPDGGVMYHADSPENSIHRYQFDASDGTLSGRTLFATTPRSVHPDGSTVDAEGGMWNAQWGGRQLVRYAPDGRVDVTVQMPVSQPTCVAFGGETLDLLFVTSARLGMGREALDREPSAGNLFVYRTGFIGLPATRFL